MSGAQTQSTDWYDPNLYAPQGGGMNTSPGTQAGYGTVTNAGDFAKAIGFGAPMVLGGVPGAIAGLLNIAASTTQQNPGVPSTMNTLGLAKGALTSFLGGSGGANSNAGTMSGGTLNAAGTNLGGGALAGQGPTGLNGMGDITNGGNSMSGASGGGDKVGGQSSASGPTGMGGYAKGGAAHQPKMKSEIAVAGAPPPAAVPLAMGALFHAMMLAKHLQALHQHGALHHILGHKS